MSKKKLIAGAAAATVLTLGGGAAIAAQQAPETTASDSKQEQQEPSYKGSVKAPADTAADAGEGKEGSGNEAADKKQETGESQKLQNLAQIDRAAAEKAALGAVPGTVKDAELGNENGYVVWDVEVVGQGGKVTDVKVDAGNGKVLAQETGDNEGSDKGAASEGNEGPEANEAQEGNSTTNR